MNAIKMLLTMIIAAQPAMACSRINSESASIRSCYEFMRDPNNDEAVIQKITGFAVERNFSILDDRPLVYMFNSETRNYVVFFPNNPKFGRRLMTFWNENEIQNSEIDLEFLSILSELEQPTNCLEWIDASLTLPKR